MKNIFTAHPHSVNETYFQHCKFALQFSAELFLGSAACFIHAFFPFLFERTGSNYLFKSFSRFLSRTPNKRDERLVKLAESINKKNELS